MIEYIDECVGCPAEMGCLGSACRYRNIPHYICDGCGEVFKEAQLREADGHLCRDCLFDAFPKAKEDGVCSLCGEALDADELAVDGGVTLCADCLFDAADKMREEAFA